MESGAREHPDPEALRAVLAEPDRARADEAERLVQADPVTGAFSGLGVRLRGARRLGLYRAARGLCPEAAVEAAGLAVRAAMGREELWRFYLPICEAALDLCSSRRALLGVAGPGAAGKSVLAALIAAILNRTAAGHGVRAAAFGLDGFHFPNAELDARTFEHPIDGSVPLRSVKGAPASFDVEGFVGALDALRRQDAVDLPGYDRRLHEPVPAAVRVGREHRVVVVEGNYLLLDAGLWARVRPALDMCLFVRLAPDALRAAMIGRHVRGGRSAQEAEDHYERVDRANAQLIEHTMPRADLVVERDADQRVVWLHVPHGRVDAVRAP